MPRDVTQVLAQLCEEGIQTSFLTGLPRQRECLKQDLWQLAIPGKTRAKGGILEITLGTASAWDRDTGKSSETLWTSVS